jgi:hypothetical protein
MNSEEYSSDIIEPAVFVLQLDADALDKFDPALNEIECQLHIQAFSVFIIFFIYILIIF